MELNKTLMSLGAMVPYSFIAFVGVLWVQRLLRMLERYSYHADKKEMLNNLAATGRLVGVYLAVGTGLSGVFAGEDHSFLRDLAVSVVYATVTPILTIFSLWINDVFVLPGVNNTQAIREGNNAVAVVEFGGLFATGLMIKAAMMGESDGFIVFVATLVYFVLGQVMMVLLVLLYEKAHAKALPIVKEVEKGNLAAGVLLAGKLIAYGLIMSTAIAGPSKGWLADLASFAFTAVAGMIFLYILEWAADKLIVTWRTVAQILSPNEADPSAANKNLSAALAHAGIKIALASPIASMVV